jgi:hypothetical protein
VLRRYAPSETPEQIEPDIVSALHSI